MDSNHRHADSESAVLPAELSGIAPFWRSAVILHKIPYAWQGCRGDRRRFGLDAPYVAVWLWQFGQSIRRFFKRQSLRSPFIWSSWMLIGSESQVSRPHSEQRFWSSPAWSRRRFFDPRYDIAPSDSFRPRSGRKSELFTARPITVSAIVKALNFRPIIDILHAVLPFAPRARRTFLPAKVGV